VYFARQNTRQHSAESPECYSAADRLTFALLAGTIDVKNIGLQILKHLKHIF